MPERAGCWPRFRGRREIPGADRRWAKGDEAGVPGFTRHVQPLLGKMGCSNRACHGSFQGKGGFRLSLFASDPALDYDNLANSGRVDPAAPDESLAILKPTLAIDHEGGLRFARGSWQHHLLRAWAAANAPYKPGAEATITRLDITPASLLLKGKGERRSFAWSPIFRTTRSRT